MGDTAFYIKHLKAVLAERCDRNPRYSVRAIAKALDIDAGTISRIMSGKQIPSYKLSKRITSRLALTTEEESQFLSSVAESQSLRNLKRVSPAFLRVQAKNSSCQPTDLSIDFYRIVADWYHAAILELTFTHDFESSPRWIAKELGISSAEATLAIGRLLEFGLLQRDASRNLRKTNVHLSTTDKHLTTPALRRNQLQFLEKAIQSLENDPIEERNMSSMTMAIDPEKLPLAKQMIREFNQYLCQFLETGARKRVYNLEIALYPIQKKI